MSCQGELELLSPLNRCPFCFSVVESGLKKPCDTCVKKERFCNYMGSSFEYMGVAKSLIKEFKYYDHPELAKSLSSFMLMQFLELKWPLPDLITFVPSTLTRKLERGYNQSELLAQEFGKLIAIDVKPLLKKTKSSLSQTYLSSRTRKELQFDLFELRDKDNFADKVILLIDDVCTTGTTLQAAGSALTQGFPKKIYGLTFCHAGE
jgi:competence protein ComFC